jgi:hypothetical protein
MSNKKWLGESPLLTLIYRPPPRIAF